MLPEFWAQEAFTSPLRGCLVRCTWRSQNRTVSGTAFNILNHPGKVLMNSLQPKAIRTLTLATGALLVASATVACGSDSSPSADDGTTTIRWMYDYFPTSGDAPMLAAQKNGYFVDAGLNVETTPGGEVNQIQAVATGQQDITVGPATTLLQSVEQGLPVTAVGVSQPNSPLGLICNPESGAVSGDPASLDGLTIATDPADTDGRSVWVQFRDKNDLTEKVTELSGSAAVDLLFSGQVDCLPEYLTYVPAMAELEFGAPPAVFELSKDAGVMGQTIVVNNTFLAEHPDAVREFVNAYAKGMQWTLDNQEDAVALVTETYPDLEADAVASELPALTAFWHTPLQDSEGLLVVEDSSWEQTADALIAVDSLKELPDLDSVRSTEYLPNPPVTPTSAQS
ncbi:ABC transporter substrate-binding protein [Mycolicibacterium litorale]|uniref:ABC transporter substrate-binding protein n=1 Tax=Mycolicibacterium litorale TaxID=758802 RepID=UPI003CFB4617